MNKIIFTAVILPTIFLYGCLGKQEKGVKGQAHISFGDRYQGHALVDFPIYCYGKEFDTKLTALKAELTSEYDKIQALNKSLAKDYLQETIAWIEAWADFLESSRTEWIQELKTEKAEESEKLEDELNKLNNLAMVSDALHRLLKPFLDKQRQVLDQGYNNIELEISRANTLIDKINKTIIENRIPLELYEKFGTGLGAERTFYKDYCSLERCWNDVPELRYPLLLSFGSENTSNLAIGFFGYLEGSEGYGVLFDAEHKTYGKRASLPPELTPYLSEQIKEAFYKHHFLAVPRLKKLNQQLKDLEKKAYEAMLIWGNSNGFSKAEREAAINSADDADAYARRIQSKKEELQTVADLDVELLVETEISNLKEVINKLKATTDTENVTLILENYQPPTLSRKRLDEWKYLGITQPEPPEYHKVDFDSEILSLFATAVDELVFTNLKGEFIIPNGITTVFSMFEGEDEQYFWINSITENTKELSISIPTVTAHDPIELIFNNLPQ